MSFKINVSSASEIDLIESFVFYEEKEKGLGGKFIDCIDDAFELISETPQQFRLVYKNVRRFIINANVDL